MKKIALFLALIILTLVFLPSCSTGGSIVGTFKGDLDLSEEIEAMFTTEDMGGYFDDVTFKNFKVSVVYEFSEDGTYKVYIDEDSKKELNSLMFASMKDEFVEYLSHLYIEAGGNFQEVLDHNNLTVDAFIMMMLESIDVTRVLGNVDDELCYKAEGGKLYSADTPEELSEATFYLNYKVSGSSLKFTGGSREDLEENLFFALLFETKLKRQ